MFAQLTVISRSGMLMMSGFIMIEDWLDADVNYTCAGDSSRYIPPRITRYQIVPVYLCFISVINICYP